MAGHTLHHFRFYLGLEQVWSVGKVRQGTCFFSLISSCVSHLFFLLNFFMCVYSCVRAMFWLIDLCSGLFFELLVSRRSFSSFLMYFRGRFSVTYGRCLMNCP
jgi:hypothetical protein